MTSTLNRVTNRAKRQVIARFAPVNRLVQNAYEARVREHRPHLPTISPSTAALIEEVETTGVAVTSLDALGIPGTERLKVILDDLKASLAGRDPEGASALKPAHDELMADAALWRWGLQQELLDLVENYVGLPVTYYGAAVYREVADGRVEGTRQWHRDIEDHKVFKILVWIDDVTPQGGALQYVPRPVSDPAVKELRYVAGFVPDVEMEKVVPPAEWVKAVGPRWTAVLADPARILHRASPAEDKDRYSVTFTWTSRNPIKTMPAAEPFTADEDARIRAGLTPEQLACLPA
ncbi:hypothetical protein SAMN04488544_0832 [Microlunatus sagamiharensis]|uniref:Phytanoyl-CoA dioxygenase (PhyH) n=1 Tax=Microlunatus sagamiharensis TaxID=546874 RepID=A0A1H2LVP8_9ACTN|nr:hypothetical protein [Microlunatus sagamiharensis]SDU84396.1 hypothetical protein SAMN04488544_0832 [Microlunatus sagamiharensis]